MPRLPFSAAGYQDPPNINHAQHFLYALDNQVHQFLFVMIKPGEPLKVGRQLYTPAALREMAKSNLDGYNIYVTVNEMDYGRGHVREAELVSKFRAVFADDDGEKGLIEGYPIPPSAIIETSPGKKQVYWFLEDQPPNQEEWDGVQQCIVDEWGGTAEARDAARILRVPGFYNVKAEYQHPPKSSIILLSPEVRYTWHEILKAFPPAPIMKSLGGRQGEALHLAQTMELAATGANYHQANLSLAGWFYNAGIQDRDKLVSILQGMMDVQGNPEDGRFEHRRNTDIPTSVDWVIKKRKEEESAKSKPLVFTEGKNVLHDKYTQVPIPGGGMYRVIQWVKSIMRYPKDDIATTVAEHLVSVFGAGRYHLMNNTTTRKRIVLGPSGIGKNTITRATGLVVSSLLELSREGLPFVINADDYLGSDAFSFSIQHKQMEEHRSRSFIVNEAGEAGASKAGDIGTLRAYQLQALSTKADELFVPKKFSEQGKNGKENQLKSVYGGTWVYYHESTSKSYAQLLNDSAAFVNGDLSRADIFFIDPVGDGKVNESIQGMNAEMQVYFANLANGNLRGTQGVEGTMNYKDWQEINYEEIREDLKKLEQKILADRKTAYRNENEIEIALVVRRFEKILTTILICALADAGGQYCPTARQEHLEYAIRRADALEKSLRINSTTTGILSDDGFARLETYVVGRFKEMIKNRLAKSKGRLIGTVMVPANTGGSQGLHWAVSLQTIDNAITADPYKDWVKVHRGDAPLAKKKLMQALCDRDIIRRAIEKSGENEFKPTRKHVWWLNKDLFPIKESYKKYRF